MMKLAEALVHRDLFLRESFHANKTEVYLEINFDRTYRPTDFTIDSSKSNELSSVFLLLISLWKIPKTGSSWFSAIIDWAALGMMAASSLVKAGTLPLVSHKVGINKGEISPW